jgi:hypothetical protein
VVPDISGTRARICNTRFQLTKDGLYEIMIVQTLSGMRAMRGQERTLVERGRGGGEWGEGTVGGEIRELGLKVRKYGGSGITRVGSVCSEIRDLRIILAVAKSYGLMVMISRSHR